MKYQIICALLCVLNAIPATIAAQELKSSSNRRLLRASAARRNVVKVNKDNEDFGELGVDELDEFASSFGMDPRMLMSMSMNTVTTPASTPVTPTAAVPAPIEIVVLPPAPLVVNVTAPLVVNVTAPSESDTLSEPQPAATISDQSSGEGEPLVNDDLYYMVDDGEYYDDQYYAVSDTEAGELEVVEPVVAEPVVVEPEVVEPVVVEPENDTNPPVTAESPSETLETVDIAVSNNTTDTESTADASEQSSTTEPVPNAQETVTVVGAVSPKKTNIGGIIGVSVGAVVALAAAGFIAKKKFVDAPPLNDF